MKYIIGLIGSWCHSTIDRECATRIVITARRLEKIIAFATDRPDCMESLKANIAVKQYTETRQQKRIGMVKNANGFLKM